MTVFAQNAWADVFNSEDHRQSQQQTAYFLLKGKAEEQLGLSEEIVEGLLITLEALKDAVREDRSKTIRSLDDLAANQAGQLLSRLADFTHHFHLMEKARG